MAPPPLAPGFTHRGTWGFRAPGDVSLILPERREPVVADAGRKPRPLADLDERERALFDAQLHAFQIGCRIAAASDLNANFGIPVPHELVAQWRAVFDSWQALRRARTAEES